MVFFQNGGVMITKHNDMVEGKKYCERNWNDTAANYLTRQGDRIIVNTLIRYPWRDTTREYSLPEFDSWRAEIVGQSIEGL